MPYILWGDEFKPQYVVAVKNLELGFIGTRQTIHPGWLGPDNWSFSAQKLLYCELWAC